MMRDQEAAAMIAEGFLPRGGCIPIRNGLPGQHGSPPADHWVDHPAL